MQFEVNLKNAQIYACCFVGGLHNPLVISL